MKGVAVRQRQVLVLNSKQENTCKEAANFENRRVGGEKAQVGQHVDGRMVGKTSV